MRTTIDLEPDVAAAIELVREDERLGLSEAVSVLIWRALVSRLPRKPFVQQTYDMGLKIDIDNVADALELLDGPSSR